MNTKAILKSTGRFLRIIWDGMQEYLTEIGEFLLRKKWWFVAALLCLVFIPVFLTLHYEKGLGVGDALFFSLAGIFGAALIAAIVVFILIWLLPLIGRIVKAIRENNQEVPAQGEEEADTPPVSEGLTNGIILVVLSIAFGTPSTILTMALTTTFVAAMMKCGMSISAMMALSW